MRPRDRHAPWILASLSGALLALAFPGSGSQSWLGFVGLVPLLVAIDGETPARAARLGLASAVVFWLGTIAWTVPGVMKFADVGWLRAMVVFAAMIALLSAFTAVFCALVARAAPATAARYVVVTASLWVALELARTEWIVRFPWNVLGSSQYRHLGLIQVAAVTGVYGVSFVLVAANAALARLVLGRRRWADELPGAGVALVALALALTAAWVAPARATAPSVEVALAQGNIDQAAKWDPAYRAETFRVYRDLTLDPAARGARLIVWPETSVPLLRRDDPQWADVERLARESGRELLVGAPDWQRGRPRNSAFLFDARGTQAGRYDKRHLVPFGEYVPFPRLLFFLKAIAGNVLGEFVPGSEPGILVTDVGRIGVVICYEAIFPSDVRELFTNGVDVLVNITNDAWFGRSPAPAQHLAMAVFRAVENRTYLVRAANSGISAIVAPDGRIVRESGLFTRELITGRIAPRAETTFYTSHGDVFAWLCVGLATLAVPLPLVSRRRVEQTATPA